MSGIECGSPHVLGVLPKAGLGLQQYFSDVWENVKS